MHKHNTTTYACAHGIGTEEVRANTFLVTHVQHTRTCTHLRPLGTLRAGILLVGGLLLHTHNTVMHVHVALGPRRSVLGRAWSHKRQHTRTCTHLDTVAQLHPHRVAQAHNPPCPSTHAYTHTHTFVACPRSGVSSSSDWLSDTRSMSSSSASSSSPMGMRLLLRVRLAMLVDGAESSLGRVSRGRFFAGVRVRLAMLVDGAEASLGRVSRGSFFAGVLGCVVPFSLGCSKSSSSDILLEVLVVGMVSETWVDFFAPGMHHELCSWSGRACVVERGRESVRERQREHSCTLT